MADATASRMFAELRSAESTLERLSASADSRSALTATAVRSSCFAGLAAVREVRSTLSSGPAAPGDDRLLEALSVAEKVFDHLRVLADTVPMNDSSVAYLAVRAIAELHFARAVVESRKA